MKKILIEIGTEELPTSFVDPATTMFQRIMELRLDENHIEFGERTTYGTPRRLALIIDVDENRKTVMKKINGPPSKAAFDKDGKPTKTLLGFVKKYGIEPDAVKRESTPKGEYLYIETKEGGGRAFDTLEKILPEIISQISANAPKTMRWGDGTVRFGRPIRSILALMDEQVLNFTLEGITSGNKTSGHRFLSDGPIEITSPDVYVKKLEEASVIVSREKREKEISTGIEAVAKKLGCTVIEDVELLYTVSHLTEYPVAVAGSFDESYLDLPRELLITVMKHHQKYFSLEKPKGKITNGFIAISNISCGDMATIRSGYERVLSARLSDARFFFDEDRKKSLDDFAKKLGGIAYQKGLGTIADKVERIKKIAVTIAGKYSSDNKEKTATAAHLCKADLSTSMVFEFPELQGIMGREYAIAEGIDGEVAVAIDDHYRPRFSGDELPSNDIGVCVALADKIDTICGFFALGKIPTGSEDPFSLRRHALGIIRILLASREGLLLSDLITEATAALPDELKKKTGEKELLDSITAFFEGRLKAEFTSIGFSYDVVDAVLATGFSNLKDTRKRAEALEEMKKEDYSEALATTFKRAANIVKEHESSAVDESALGENAEKDLFRAVTERGKKITSLLESKNFPEALKEIAAIRPTLDNFFDSVMVMVEDDTMRMSRLGILRRVVNLFKGVADFSRLVFS
jgi:glycyl-tRNA synthetase beta chain